MKGVKFTLKKTKISVDFKGSFFSRFKGLMLERELADNYAILLSPADRVHSHFMFITIDVIYLDKDNVVLDFEELKPWKLGKKVKGTMKVLEGAVGLSNYFEIGEKLVFEEFD